MDTVQDDCSQMCDQADRTKCCKVALQPMKSTMPEFKMWIGAKHEYETFKKGYDVTTATDSDFEKLHQLFAQQAREKQVWKSSDARKTLNEHQLECAVLDASLKNGCVTGGAAGTAVLRGRRNAQRVRQLERMIGNVVMQVMQSQMTDSLLISTEKRRNAAQELLRTSTEAKSLAEGRVDALHLALVPSLNMPYTFASCQAREA